MKLIATVLFTMLFSVFHAEHIAEYRYQLIGNQLNLRFVIEKPELDEFNFSSDCDVKQMTALCLTQYINKKSEVQINGETIAFKLNESYTEKDHLIINLSATINCDLIEELVISNRCFYEFNPQFKNRILLDVSQFQKTYLLTKANSKIRLN